MIIPEFDPKAGRTDFLDDVHLSYIHSYAKFILSLESLVGSDVRMRMEGYGYEQFCQRVNKQLKYDSQRHTPDYF